jgi:hypothetical protein
MTQPKLIGVCGRLSPRSLFNLFGQRPFRSDRIGGDAGGVSGAEPASGFPLGSSIEIAQRTLVELRPWGTSRD